MAYQHVLSVYDGTPASQELLNAACRIARSQRARLTILHVRLVSLKERLPSYELGADPDTDAQVSAAEQLAEKHGIPAASAVRYARRAGPAVVSEARVRGVDLIALPLPDPQRLPPDDDLGDDARLVLHRAACAVLLYRPAR